MSWLNYDTIQSDLAALIRTNVTAFNLVKRNADERDIAFNNMPMADVRLVEDQPGIRAGQDYFNTTTFDIEILAHSLESQDAAAMVRNPLLTSLIDTVRANSRFSGGIEATEIGPIAFASGTDEKTGAFVAAATVRIYVKSYVDRS